MFKSYLLRLKTRYLNASEEQKGQSIIIVTFAFLGLLAMLGLALDLGLVYIEQVRISRTTDAAALASVIELPFEEEAVRRAVEFIELNGYNVGQDTQVLVRGCIDVGGGTLKNVDESGELPVAGTVPITPTNSMAGFSYLPAVASPRATFVIDTLAYQPSDASTQNQDNCKQNEIYGTANKIRVTGQVNVRMNFMQFFGRKWLPVRDEAVGENVTNLDVTVVFDVSGSMDFETTCFGCWEKDDDLVDNPFPNNGNYNPLPDTTQKLACTAAPSPAIDDDGFKSFVHEAELYARDVPLHGWEFERRIAGQGFWVLQRQPNNGASIYDPDGTQTRGAYLRPHPLTTYSQSSTANYPQLQGAAYNGECFNGPDLSGECWKPTADGLGEPPPLSNVPWVEYDFTPTADWGGETHVWIRAQGGGDYAWKWNGQSPTSLPPWRKAIYWQIGRPDIGSWSDVSGQEYGQLLDDGWDAIREPDRNKWRWVKLGSTSTTPGVLHTLRLYQGSTGFYLDKVILTNNPTGNTGVAVDDSGNDHGGSVDADFRDLLEDGGPTATDGSATREACNLCNPALGLTVDPADCSCNGGTGVGCTEVLTTTNQLSNDLYHDEDPLRSAKEAVKKFAQRLDPKFDQLGIVAYSSSVKNGSVDHDNDGSTPRIPERVELQCLRWAAANEAQGQRKCYDPATTPISYTNVIKTVEVFDNNGGTNIADGMEEGLEELGIEVPGINEGIDSSCDDGTNDKEVCDRRGAARRVLILMTDGSPNQNFSCGGSLWTGNFGQGNTAYDCAIYMARQAARNNVTVYTIGIGSGVNVDLLTAMATGTDPGTGDVYFEGRGGEYYPAAKPTDLDRIFEQILEQIFVRIVG